MSHYLAPFLPFVQKPGRYLGREVNTIIKNRADVRFSFCLAFPDTYEVGMSHLGLHILYGLLNREEDVVAERCFAPWPDMEQIIRQNGLLLSSLESQTPLRAFDLVGFSLQYELSFTNVLNMLNLGGIPVRRSERRADDPIVCAGGPCAFNPAPMQDFIDFFVIGEGEEVILEIAKTFLLAKKRGKKRKEILELLAEIQGIYCPDFHPDGRRIKKRVVQDLNESFFPDAPPVPLVKAVHDRITIEIARGCTRGCRFCQAGMVWRPVRERNPDVIAKLAEDLVAATGQDEISLLALSAGDYFQIAPLITRLANRYAPRRIALALPSLRVETLAGELIEQIKRIRKTSFTIAPEAGTQRLRDMINKCNTDADLLTTVKRVFDAGWRAVKLYFMIGLPGETVEDLYGIADLVTQVLMQTRQGGQITVSVSTFVPKAHTPFQWEAQIGLEETREKQELLKSLLRHRRLEFRWHDARMSLLEGLLSRGDAEMGKLVERAFVKGCRFDGWADMLRYDLWQEAIGEFGLDVEEKMSKRHPSGTLPWDFIDGGLDKGFLLSEAWRAKRAELTPDCRTSGCYHCGACDHEVIRPMEAKELPQESWSARSLVEGEKKTVRCRLLFTKRGLMRFLSHLELSTVLQRALVRAHLPLQFTAGFRPHPKMSFAYATAVGMESKGEYVDIYLHLPDLKTDELPERVNKYLPAGIKILHAWKLPDSTPSLAESIESFTFSAILPPSEVAASEIREKVKDFLSQERWEIVFERKGQKETREVRHLVEDMSLHDEGRLILKIKFSPHGMVSPVELLVSVLGLSREQAKAVEISKEFTTFKTNLLTDGE
ncbi:MAG TPA: TIGR03960 family B12-binding radical SAM protein [Syntrophales bacterium]|nr:TIGR03960 family B12-binding radical SAM protein [Syntrophales bacterium]HOL59514.1 TIGR03960 family B12-binding radical SAM protein [Syntrophales bacterium]HPO35604.1 TIGR03960 family B12-binding radical SAM protein [Syntrophales bacterium]